MDESSNPKNIAARNKVHLALLPAAGVIHGAHACMAGARKYGAYNWREEKIALMAYVSAAMRHLLCYVDGEEFDGDSGCHHLGHVIATCAIMLDAIERGGVIDDRPPWGSAKPLLNRLNEASAVCACQECGASFPKP